MLKEFEAARYRRAELMKEFERQRSTQRARTATRRPFLRTRMARELLDVAFALEAHDGKRALTYQEKLAGDGQGEPVRTLDAVPADGVR
ncbi:MAG: hypothetical protein M3317_16780 [Actinomycetota bacterium]|nr:hypothetical protein [Actinomycetota bacterium]